MKWTKPEPHLPSARWYLQGEDGWLLCKALVHGEPVYTLSHRGRLVCTGSLSECKRRADEDFDAD